MKFSIDDGAERTKVKLEANEDDVFVRADGLVVGQFNGEKNTFEVDRASLAEKGIELVVTG